MKIHGLRVYPQSVDVIRGEGAPILVHGGLSEEWSDFRYVFHPLAVALRDHVVVHDFAISYTELGVREDPILKLRDRFGASLLDADVASQLMLLRGDDFESWADTVYFAGGAFLPVCREIPPFDALTRLFWGGSRLTSDTWPSHMRALLHMWDDIYWQLFTTEPSDLDLLIQAHRGDAKLKMYFVDLDLEYPEPSGRMLQSATAVDES
jgi:hypothetical protein